MTKLSIGIVTYNSSKDITTCIDSIQKYTKDLDYKIYLSDNLSTDNTVELLENNYPNIKIFKNKENKGFGYGHNKIINHINSEYHLILNPDIQIQDNILKNLVEILEQNKEYALISPKILNSDGTEQHLPKKNPKLSYLLSGRILQNHPYMIKLRNEYTMANQDIDLFQEVDILTGCFMLFRTQQLKNINGFDEKYFMYFEDLDLSKRISKFGKLIFYSGDSVIHRWERASNKNIKLLTAHIRSMIIYYSKKLLKKLG